MGYDLKFKLKCKQKTNHNKNSDIFAQNTGQIDYIDY